MNRATKEGIELERLGLDPKIEDPIIGCWTGDFLVVRANWNFLKEGYDNTGQTYPWSFLKNNPDASEGWQSNEREIEQWLKVKANLL